MNCYLKFKKINMNIKNILIINYWCNKGVIIVLILKSIFVGNNCNICDNLLWNIKISV